MFPFKIPSVAYPSTGGSPSALFNWRYVANSDPLFAQLLLSSVQTLYGKLHTELLQKICHQPNNSNNRNNRCDKNWQAAQQCNTMHTVKLSNNNICRYAEQRQKQIPIYSCRQIFFQKLKMTGLLQFL